MTDSTVFGFALRRNGTCLASERSCGATARPFYACCPLGSICANPYNQVCCSSSENCTSSAVEQPACANRSWNLYNNGGVEGAFFCCLNSTFGYGVGLDTNGCADPDYQLAGNETPLQEQRQAAASSSSASASPAATSTPTASDAGHSSNGATIGGAVGGAIGGVLLILLLAFFSWRWRKQRRQHHEPQISSKYETADKLNKIDPKDQQAGGVEISGQQAEAVHEMSGQAVNGVHEIYGHQLTELPLSGPGTTR